MGNLMKKRQRKKIECIYWTAKEYADLIGVHLNTLYAMIKRGELKAVRVGRGWRIRKSDVE